MVSHAFKILQDLSQFFQVCLTILGDYALRDWRSVKETGSCYSGDKELIFFAIM